MSRGPKNSRVSSEQERANREILVPPELSWQDKLCYRTIEALARLQVLILERCVKEHVWRSGTGKVMRIRDLNDSHLENIVHMINRDGYVIEEHLRKAIFDERVRRWAERGIYLDPVQRLNR
jgi:hypothetical protein